MIDFYGTLFHSDFARFTQLSRAEIIVYTAIIAHGGKTRTFTGSHRKIAEICGISIPSVKRALKKFESNEWMASTAYYQVKQYTMLQSQQSDLDHNTDPPLGHNCDLPNNCTVDHNSDLPLDHNSDLPPDQDCDPHVIENNKEEYNSLHVMAETNDEKIFCNLVSRWKNLLNWKEDPLSLLSEWRQVRLDNSDVDVALELQVIDSWLMTQFYNRTGRAWRVGWFDAIKRWIQRENAQGGRKSLALAKVQRYYLNFAVTSDSIDYPPNDTKNHVPDDGPVWVESVGEHQSETPDAQESEDDVDEWSEETILRGVHHNILTMFGGADKYVHQYRTKMVEEWERSGYDVAWYRDQLSESDDERT